MVHLPEKKDNRSNFKAILFIIVFIFLSINLSAQDQITDSLVNERIQSIQNILEHSKTNANRWYYGWLAGYSAATIGQGAVYFIAKDIGTKQDMTLGASTTFLGAAGQLLTPMDPGIKAEILAHTPDSTKQERLKKLIDAEELFKSAATRENAGISWQAHVLCGAVNIGSGLITWLGFKRSVWSGVGNFALNTVITEAQIWTQPTQILKNYKNYCQKYKPGTMPVAYKPKPAFYVNAYPGGISIRLLF
jgi:hypothetical protein